MPEIYSVASYACDGQTGLTAKALSGASNLIGRLKYKTSNGKISIWMETTGANAEVGLVILSGSGYTKMKVADTPPSDALTPTLV